MTSFHIPSVLFVLTEYVIVNCIWWIKIAEFDSHFDTPELMDDNVFPENVGDQGNENGENAAENELVKYKLTERNFNRPISFPQSFIYTPQKPLGTSFNILC